MNRSHHLSHILSLLLLAATAVSLTAAVLQPSAPLLTG